MQSKTQTRMAAIDRRGFMAASGTALLAAPFIRAASAKSRTLTIRDPGGPVGEAYRKAFFEPFSNRAGIDVVGVQSSHGPTGEIKAMVEAGNYAWDGALLDMSDVAVLTDRQYLETVSGPGGLGPNASQIPADLRNDILPECREPERRQNWGHRSSLRPSCPHDIIGPTEQTLPLRTAPEPEDGLDACLRVYRHATT